MRLLVSCDGINVRLLGVSLGFLGLFESVSFLGEFFLAFCKRLFAELQPSVEGVFVCPVVAFLAYPLLVVANLFLEFELGFSISALLVAGTWKLNRLEYPLIYVGSGPSSTFILATTFRS